MMITATVCLSLLFAGAAIVIIEVVHPEAETAAFVSTLGSVLNILLGAVLGLLAGKSERVKDMHRRPDGETDDL